MHGPWQPVTLTRRALPEQYKAGIQCVIRVNSNNQSRISTLQECLPVRQANKAYQKISNLAGVRVKYKYSIWTSDPVGHGGVMTIFLCFLYEPTKQACRRTQKFDGSVNPTVSSPPEDDRRIGRVRLCQRQPKLGKRQSS